MIRNPFSTTKVSERLNVALSLADLFTVWGIFTLSALGLVVASSCVFTFSCSEFLPTISYLASYSIYDRFIIFTITAQVIPLLLFFLSTFLQYRKYFDRLDSWVLLLLSIASTLILPGVVAIDEVNSSYYLNFDRIHVILLSILILCIGLWTTFSFEWLYKIYREKPQRKIIYIAGYVLACLCSLIDGYFEWKDADNTGRYVKLAVKEYITIALFAFLPKVYLLCIDVKISLVRTKILTDYS